MSFCPWIKVPRTSSEVSFRLRQKNSICSRVTDKLACDWVTFAGLGKKFPYAIFSSWEHLIYLEMDKTHTHGLSQVSWEVTTWSHHIIQPEMYKFQNKTAAKKTYTSKNSVTYNTCRYYFSLYSCKPCRPLGREIMSNEQNVC